MRGGHQGALPGDQVDLVGLQRTHDSRMCIGGCKVASKHPRKNGGGRVIATDCHRASTAPHARAAAIITPVPARRDGAAQKRTQTVLARAHPS